MKHKRGMGPYGLITLAAMLTALCVFFPSASSQAQGCEYWAAPPPEGKDQNPGTFLQPWATLEHASEQALASGGAACTVWFKDGTYNGANDLDERFASPVTFKAVHPYKAVLQYSGTALELSGARNIIIEGFELRHSGPGAGVLLAAVDRSDQLWSENITFRNNIFHDSYNNDLLKIYNGARFISVIGNIFYNQGSNEQHMDVNSVTDVTIQDNIFFNDYAGSGRSNLNDTKAFIVIKDSNENEDGLEGSERIAIRRNIFLNWEGGREPFLQVGNDGKAYFEAEDILVENNLLIGNSLNEVSAALAVSGAKNVTFAHNTVAGGLPSSAYAFQIDIKDLNPENQNIYFYNNLWSDPTGTMGANLAGSDNEFSDGSPADTNNLVLDNNLYWNGAAPIPPGELVSPLVDDAHRVVGDPRLASNVTTTILPRWTGSAFLSGNQSIRQEFVRLVILYGAIAPSSPAVGRANPDYSPIDDILGRIRSAPSDLGAYESNPSLSYPRFLPMIKRGR